MTTGWEAEKPLGETGEEEEGTEGLAGYLSPSAYNTFNTLLTFGYSESDALSIAENYDLAQAMPKDQRTAEDDTYIKEVEGLIGRLKAQRLKQEEGYSKFSYHPVDWIRTELLNGLSGPFSEQQLQAIKKAQSDPAYGGRYGTTLEDWATQRAQEIHYGLVPKGKGTPIMPLPQGWPHVAGQPTPEISDFESRLQRLMSAGHLTPDEYAMALFLRSAGNVPLSQGGSTETQKKYAAEYYLTHRTPPPIEPPTEETEIPTTPLLNPSMVPPGGFIEPKKRQKPKEWDELVQRTKERITGF